MGDYQRRACDLQVARSHIPYLYDFFYEMEQAWPMYTSCWGPLLPGNTAFVPRSYGEFQYQRLYYAQSTDSTYDPVWKRLNGLPHLLAQAEIALPTKFNQMDMERAARTSLPSNDDAGHEKNGTKGSAGVSASASTGGVDYRCWLKDGKRLVHPGEVNRIAVSQSLPDIALTHTDHPRVLVWDFNRQPVKMVKTHATAHQPDLALVGHDGSEEVSHEKVLYFALDAAKSEPMVASGGPDCNVCVWSLADYEAVVSVAVKQHEGERRMACRTKFTGHTACVEDVVWHPRSTKVLASVSDDRTLRLWDTRVNGSGGGLVVETGHSSDVNALAWNSEYDQFILTASSDHTINLLDIRIVRDKHLASTRSGSVVSSRSSPRHVLHTFAGHERDVKCVTWSPDGQLFASGGDDARVNIWSLQNLQLHEDSNQLGPVRNERSMDSFFDSENDRVRVKHEVSTTTTPPPAVTVSASRKSGKPSLSQAYSRALVSSSKGPVALQFSHLLHPSAVLSLNWNHHHSGCFTLSSISGIDGGLLQVWRINKFLVDDIVHSNELVRVAKKARREQEVAQIGTSPTGSNNGTHHSD